MRGDLDVKFLKKLLSKIALTFGSMLLFCILMSLYFVISYYLEGNLSTEAVPWVFANALFMTMVVFFALLYFPLQTAVLMIGRYTRLCLFILPALAALTAIGVSLYYLKVSPPEYGLLEDYFFYEYIGLGITGLIFVMLNNLIFVKER